MQCRREGILKLNSSKSAPILVSRLFAQYLPLSEQMEIGGWNRLSHNFSCWLRLYTYMSPLTPPLKASLSLELNYNVRGADVQ